MFEPCACGRLHRECVCPRPSRAPASEPPEEVRETAVERAAEAMYLDDDGRSDPWPWLKADVQTQEYWRRRARVAYDAIVEHERGR